RKDWGSVYVRRLFSFPPVVSVTGTVVVICLGARDGFGSVVVVTVLSLDGGGCVRSEKGVVWRRLRRFLVGGDARVWW
ncbi:hypothetical protein A2U01_0062645, partial [Trifolium medium]|nr:hypothetical protein [Trifolium medium]